MNAPIALFVYNRPVHTRRTLQALSSCKMAAESRLFIFSDGPKTEAQVESVRETREVLNEIAGFQEVTITKRDRNLGLANSIITGVSELMDQFGCAIVLEDDLITAPSFLVYMNSALSAYQEDKRVFSISGYNFPPTLFKLPPHYSHQVFLSYRNSSWGWASWTDRWQKVDWEVQAYPEFIRDSKARKQFNRGGDDMTDLLKAQMEGVIDSWSIRFTFAHFEQQGYSLYPVHPLVDNIGQDGSGTHYKDLGRKKILNSLETAPDSFSFPEGIQFDEEVGEAFRNIFSYSFKFRAKRAIQHWIGYKHWRHLIKS